MLPEPSGPCDKVITEGTIFFEIILVRTYGNIFFEIRLVRTKELELFALLVIDAAFYLQIVYFGPIFKNKLIISMDCSKGIVKVVLYLELTVNAVNLGLDLDITAQAPN